MILDFGRVRKPFAFVLPKELLDQVYDVLLLRAIWVSRLFVDDNSIELSIESVALYLVYQVILEIINVERLARKSQFIQ